MTQAEIKRCVAPYRRALEDLIVALDRMYGSTSVSQNVIEAKGRAKHLLLDLQRDPKDESGKR